VFVYETKAAASRSVYQDMKGVIQLENVFNYFVAIGSGLTVGIVIVLAPCYLIYKKIENRRKPTNVKGY
jgi:hypothetical protein